LTADEEATIVATLNVENNKEGNTASLEQKLNVVSGEAAPAPVIIVNPVSNQEVEAAGEQEITVSVGIFNNGNADAEGVVVKVYQQYGTDLDNATVNVAKDGGSAIATLKFNYDIQQATTFHVAVYYNNVLTTDVQDFTVSVKEQIADLSIVRIADITATTEEEVKVAATIQNASDIKAEKVLVALYNGTEIVGTAQEIAEIAAGETAQVEFNLGKLAAGTYNYNVMITNTDANTDNNVQPVTIKVSEPEVETVAVALTQVNVANGHIDLAAETNTASVWVANQGNVDANATISLTLNNTVLEAQTVNVKAHRNGSASFTLPTEGLVAGQKATLVATVTVENNTAETVSETKEYDIVDSSVATEPVFEVAAQPVEVEFGAEKFNVVATVKNVSEIAATNVEVSLFHNSVIATQTVETLAAGAETTLTFENVENPFTKAGEYTMYVQAPKAQAEVKVTVKAADEEKKVDMALIAIQGISEIDLNAENNNITVWYENKGNVTVASATITAKMGETDLEAQTVENIKPESIGYVTFTLPTTSLTTGETVKVVATIAATGDEVAENNTFEKEYEVTDATSTEAEFELTAQDVEVELAAETITVTVNVKNVGSQAGSDIEVNLFYNGVIAAQPIETLFPDGEQTLTFTFDNIFKQAGTYTVYAMTADRKYISTFNVTVKPETVEQKVDLAVTAIHGSLSLDVENNSLTVFVDNLGTVDMTNVPVRLTIGNGVYTGTIASVKAGTENNFCSFTIPATDLWVGEVNVTATVTAENDVDENNNTLERNYTIAAPQAELSFTVEAKAVANAEAFDVVVTVTNSEKADAENIVVTVYDEKGTMVGTATINQLAAGVTENVAISVEKVYAEGGTYKNQFQVVVSGVEGVKWVDVVVDATITAIQAVQAQYGKNVQIYTLDGKKVNNVRKGVVYIINGKKMMMK
jgi:subtilase family serine protease